MSLEKLKKLALAATPGPWSNNEAAGLEACVWSETARKWVLYNDEFQARPQEDSDYITAANPAAILKMIEVMEQMAEALKELGRYNTREGEEMAAALKELGRYNTREGEEMAINALEDYEEMRK